MSLRAARLVGAGLAAVAACTQDVTAPSQCPDFCPSGSITVVDSILRTALGRDSAFRGFVLPHEASALLAADLPGIVDSRAIFRTRAIAGRLRFGTDTTTFPIVAVDSLKLRLTVARRDTAAPNLTLVLYRLPLAMDSSTTFADLAASWTDSLRAVNVDRLLALANRRDSVTGDSIFVDTTATPHRLVVIVKLDSAMAPYVPADSGRLGFGVRVRADSLASIALGASRQGLGPLLTWYVKVDSAGKQVPDSVPRVTATVENFVFDPPAVPLDSTLAVGGVPSARSILRLALPRPLRDSVQIVRATLILVPAVAPKGAPADSFDVEAHAVIADFGAKSPLAFDTLRSSTKVIRPGTSDTVRIEVTTILRAWQADTLAPTTFILRPVAPGFGEGATFGEIRFWPSAAAGLRPALQLTYVPRFPFGKP